MSSKKLTEKVWQDPKYFIAFGFGSGLLPFAPGTWGTLAAFPLYLLFASSRWEVYFTVTVLFLVIGVMVCDKVSKEMGIHDYAGIVWDEVVGYLLTMFLAPVSMVWMIIGFILFRLFDIWKPQPIRFIDQRVKGGFGIMLDDVLAALPAWAIMQVLIWKYA